MAKKETNNINKQVGVGVGITAAVLAAAGAYFLYGSKNAAKNRKAVKSWMLKAKAEVLDKLEAAKEMSKDEYEALIKEVTSAYQGLKSASRMEIKEFKDEMMNHWNAIEKSAQPAKKVAKKVAKKAVKK